MPEPLNLAALNNLNQANAVRIARAKDKRRIAKGEISARSILKDLPAHWHSAKIVDLLLAMPAVGRKKAARWCSLGSISLETRLVDLALHQRLLLMRQIDIWAIKRDTVRRMLEGRAA